jgi:hypothetical protein
MLARTDHGRPTSPGSGFGKGLEAGDPPAGVNHIASGTATVRRPWRPSKGETDAFALLGHLHPTGELATFTA